MLRGGLLLAAGNEAVLRLQPRLYTLYIYYDTYCLSARPNRLSPLKFLVRGSARKL